MKRFILMIAAVAATLVSCDRISVHENQKHAPVITSFSPLQAPAGASITVKGEYLQDVNEAYIGNVKVEIATKVSNTLLTLTVGQDVTSGKIRLVNAEGPGVSEQDFRASFAVPTINAYLLQESAEMGDNLMISGEHLASATAVIFTAEGYEEGHVATIITASDDELIVKVPYVESSDARITFRYFDGAAQVETSLSDAPSITVVRYVPSFDPFTFKKTPVGRSVVLTGSYLNNIDRVTVGEWEAPIYKDSGHLSFTIPAGDFPDGETTVELKAWYFDNNESITLAPEFVVFVPYVKFWENVQVWAQGRVEQNTFMSFFSPENGVVYENAKWKDVLDPVAMRLQNAQWDKANVPKAGVVSDEDYYSVLPYFFISAVSGNVLQINSPANSNSQLKNFYIAATGTPANDYRVPGSNNNMPGTPILAFRPLNASNADEKAIIDKVLADQIENINEETFPIDVAGSKIAGISVASFAGGVKSSAFCDRQTDTMVDEPGYKLDAVLLVAYYHNYGYDPDARAANIKRLGLLHIKQIDWGVYNNSNYGSTSVTFDCYWQKYDYDYTKVIL